MVYFVQMIGRLFPHSNPAATGRARSRSMGSGAVPQTILGIRSRCERWAEEPLGGQWEQVEERCPAQYWHHSTECLATCLDIVIYTSCDRLLISNVQNLGRAAVWVLATSNVRVLSPGNDLISWWNWLPSYSTEKEYPTVG